MPLIDTLKNPATVTFMPSEQHDLTLLKEGVPHVPSEYAEVLGFEDTPSTGQQYDLLEVRQLTRTLMSKMMINYDKPDSVRKLETFDEVERERLKPFAFFLACLDGNSFDGCIEQYIPDAYAILTNCGHKNLYDVLAHVRY